MSRTNERETCEECRYWCRLDDMDGECRFESPRPEVCGASWPITYGSHWCGKWGAITHDNLEDAISRKRGML